MEVEEKGERERDCPKKLLMPPSFFLSLVRSSLGLSFSCPFDAREREKRVNVRRAEPTQRAGRRAARRRKTS